MRQGRDGADIGAERPLRRASSDPTVVTVTETLATGRSERQAIDDLVGRLRRRFPDVPPEGIADFVAQAHGQFADARIRDFVPVLVEHAAVDRLKGLPRP